MLSGAFTSRKGSLWQTETNRTWNSTYLTVKPHREGCYLLEDGRVIPVDELGSPPARLFEKLGQIPGYTWTEDMRHLSYDLW